MTTLKLSIIIPVYNVAEWLSETVDSILAQTFRDFELVLVDDGSTDGSGELCDQYAAGDNRIRVIHQKNAGVSVARNTGVAAAQGDYIGFTDSDDIIEADMYQRLLELAEAYDADIVQCQHDRESILNGLTRSETVEMMDGQAFVHRMFTKAGGQYTNQVALWSKIYRRELFEGIVFPVGQVYEDEQETYKLCLKAKRIVEIPDILYHYIKRENSIITGISPKKMLDKQKALLDRLYYLPERIPELEKQCCRAFLGFSTHILCVFFRENETDALTAAMQALQEQSKRLRPWLNRYERIYLPALKWKWARKIILKNEFSPIQKVILRIKSVFVKDRV